MDMLGIVNSAQPTFTLHSCGLKMAKFQGTVQEFHRFIGPRIRNAINSLTRVHRKEKQGICEFCNKQTELQSAHVQDRDRRSLIEIVLSNHNIENGEIFCDIHQIEKEILKAHEPIHDTFKFICQPCHTKYDSKSKTPCNIKSETTEFKKLSRIRRWAQNPGQENHKLICAYLELETQGNVTLDTFRKYCIEKYDVKKFNGNFHSMKTDNGNSHGKVFYEDQGLIKLYDRIRLEIENHFLKSNT